MRVALSLRSFYAELPQAGFAYPLQQCQYAFHQATDTWGMASAKARHGALHLLLDVPRTGARTFLAWAFESFRPQAGEVIFYDAAHTRLPVERISFAAGQCIAYTETFASGEAGLGAYVHPLTIHITWDKNSPTHITDITSTHQKW